MENTIRSYNLSPINHMVDVYKVSPQSCFKLAKGEAFPDVVGGKKVDPFRYKPFYGVELEVMPSDLMIKKFSDGTRANALLAAAYHVDKLINKTQRIGVCKSDGSVSGGFEIVAVPGSHLWHVTEGWEAFFDKEKGVAKYIAGWKHTSCGMHVHVSKAALTPIQIGRQLVFINDKANKEFVEKVAGRGNSTYCKMLPKTIKDGYYGGNGDRYQAINVETGKGTIEYRIFRSNTSKHGFLKNIDFVASLVTWTKEASNLALGMKDYLAWLDERRGEYKYLAHWMVKNGYFKEKHKTNLKYKEEPEMVA